MVISEKKPQLHLNHTFTWQMQPLIN